MRKSRGMSNSPRPRHAGASKGSRLTAQVVARIHAASRLLRGGLPHKQRIADEESGDGAWQVSNGEWKWDPTQNQWYRTVVKTRSLPALGEKTAHVEVKYSVETRNERGYFTFADDQVLKVEGGMIGTVTFHSREPKAKEERVSDGS